jgi:hypothetical protein
MNSLLASILVFSLIVTLPVRVGRPKVNIAPARELLAHKNESRPNEREVVKRDLLELFKLCKSERYSEAARYLVYRGPEKKREWVDVYDYKNLVERREVEGVGKGIRELLDQSDSYKLSRFFVESESEGKWHVWETTFHRGDKHGKVNFAFLKIKGHYALGDIDGHLAYLRLIKPARATETLSAQEQQAQATEQLNEIDLKVNNVGPNASYDDVLKRLGQPQRTHREKVFGRSCGPPHAAITLYYPGLKVELYGTIAGRNFRVASIEITSSEWETARGLRVGMEEVALRERLGKPEIDYADSGGRALIYKANGDSGVAALIIKGGMVVSIELALPCSKQTSNNSLNRTRAR